MIVSLSVVACVALLMAIVLYRGLKEAAGLGARTAIALLLGAALVGSLTLLLRGYLFDTLGWSLVGAPGNAQAGMKAAWLLAAPMEHATIAVVVWPLVRGHRLLRWGTALLVSLLAALGFAAARSSWDIVGFGGGTRLIGMGISTIALLVTAAGWGSLLTASRPELAKWFPLGWFGAVLIDGFVVYAVHARSSRWHWALVPVLVAMLAIAALSIRRLRGPRESVVFTRASLLGFFPDAPGMSTMRAAWKHGHRHTLLHWIVGSAVVCFGASLAGLGGGVLLARRLGIDLSRVGDSDRTAFLALLVLGGSVLVSFAIAGYLVAKASAADSVFETGMGALGSILFLTTLLSMASSAAAVLALVIAPFAFALTCVGAWVGIGGRKRSG